MKEFGVKVLIKETMEYGVITRRLDAQSYEIWIEEKNEIVILSPKEFNEIEKGDLK